MASVFWNTDVAAQAIPRPAETEKIEKSLEKPKIPKSVLDVKVPDEAEKMPPSDMEKIRFVLKNIKFEGVSVYKASGLVNLYKKLRDKEISLADVYKVAAVITARYRNDGFILSQAVVPAQRIENGTVLIKVVEGYIDSVEIEGSLGGERRRALGFANKILDSRPLRARDLERYLLLISDLAGMQARPVISPSLQNKGASQLTLAIDHSYVDGFGAVDNRGSRYNGPFRALVGLNLNSVFGLYERTGFQFVTASHPSEMIFANAYHEEPVGTEGTKITLSGSVSKSEPGYTLKEFKVEGDSAAIVAAVSHPFIRSRGENLFARMEFSSRESQTDILSELSSRDRLRIIDFGVSYDAVDRFRGINLFAVNVSQGLDIFNPTKSGTPRLSREGGKSDFTKIYGNLLRLQEIVPQWMFLAEVGWQYSLSSLLSSQEFFVGGPAFVRGYDAAEITGDHGVTIKGELRYAQDVGWEYFKDFQAYVFLDNGHVWHKQELATRKQHEFRTSPGLGIRYNLTQWISGYLEVAKPLEERVAGENSKAPRIFFSLSHRF